MTLDPRMIEAAARAGHDAYELLAPTFGYSTRPDTAVAWEQLPHDNRNLMRAAYEAGITAFLSSLSDDELVGNTGQVVKKVPGASLGCSCPWNQDATPEHLASCKGPTRFYELLPVGGEEA